MKLFTDEELSELAAFDKMVDDADFEEGDFEAGAKLDRDIKAQRKQNRSRPEYDHAYYMAHRERKIAMVKDYYRKNLDAVKKRQHDYYMSHKAEYLRRNRENYAKRKHGGQAGH